MSAQHKNTSSSPQNIREKRFPRKSGTAEPTYSEGGKFGRQKGQPESKGPVIEPVEKQAVQHSHPQNATTSGAQVEHPQAG